MNMTQPLLNSVTCGYVCLMHGKDWRQHAGSPYAGGREWEVGGEADEHGSVTSMGTAGRP